jgi:hypothetical protein
MPSPAPAAPKASSGSPVVKIILIVLAVLILFGVLSAGACVYFVYRTKQRINQFQKQVTATFPMPTATPGVPGQSSAPTPGSLPQGLPQDSAAQIDPASLLYPGATAKEGASLAMGGIQVQQYVTDDPMDKVLSFYKDKLGAKAMVQESDGHAVVQVGGTNGLVSISINRDAPSGKTKFSITRFGK